MTEAEKELIEAAMAYHEAGSMARMFPHEMDIKKAAAKVISERKPSARFISYEFGIKDTKTGLVISVNHDPRHGYHGRFEIGPWIAALNAASDRGELP